MAKIPSSPDEILSEFISDFQNLYGEDLISVILFGSGAAGTYVPKKSDINFLIILTENGIAKLAKSFSLVHKWQKRNVALPLLMTNDYLLHSLDSFPLEFYNMQKHYRVVFGQDVLKGLEIEKANLRLQCEAQIKGKLLHLREGFLSTQGKRRALENLVKASIITFTGLFKAILALKNEKIPLQRNEIILHTAEVFQLDQGLFTQLLEVADQKSRFATEELCKITESYISEIGKLTLAIDNLQ